MGGSRNWRKRRDLVVNLPPSSPSTVSSDSYTPRSLLSRWLISLQNPSPAAGGGEGGEGEAGSGLRCRVRLPRYCFKKKKRGEGGEGKVAGPSGSEPAAEAAGERVVLPPESDSVDEGRVGSGESSTELPVSSGRKPEAVSFNLGIGVGLVYLLVSSATEFNKMIELRRQMEILLKDFKGEIQRKNVTSSFSESNSNIALSASNCWADESTSNFLMKDRVSYHLVGEHSSVEPDRQSKCGRTLENKRCIKMNQLEEELEVELERLQIDLEGEDSSVLPQQQRMELENENNNPSKSSIESFEEEDNEPKQEDMSRHCGVPPRELERRLHELLEARQQERIAEMESALECAERKLREREREICWWQDTARLVSKQKDEAVFW